MAVYSVTGAGALDWEDMARGPGEEGRPALYLGEIGDNLALRPHISVYRVPEPEVRPTEGDALTVTDAAVRLDLVYEDGSRDAGTLLVHPRTGRLYVVSRERNGSGLYAAPGRLDPGHAHTLRRVGEIRFGALPRSAAGRGDPAGSRLATGGDISPDGRRVAVRTCTDAWEWSIPGDDVAGAVRRPPVPVRLPEGPGGEALAYSRRGDALLTSREGAGTPVHAMRRR